MKLRNSMVVVNSDTQQQGGSPSSCWWKNFFRKIDWSSIDKKYFAPRNVDWKTEFSNNFLTIYKRCSSAKKLFNLQGVTSSFCWCPPWSPSWSGSTCKHFQSISHQKIVGKDVLHCRKVVYLKLDGHLLLLVVDVPHGVNYVPEVLEIIFNRFPTKKIIRKENAKTLFNLLLDRHLLHLVAVVPHGVHHVAEVLKNSINWFPVKN